MAAVKAQKDYELRRNEGFGDRVRRLNEAETVGSRRRDAWRTYGEDLQHVFFSSLLDVRVAEPVGAGLAFWAFGL
ncbi:hypothetical protein Bca101_059577 [Brassica carinata]